MRRATRTAKHKTTRPKDYVLIREATGRAAGNRGRSRGSAQRLPDALRRLSLADAAGCSVRALARGAARPIVASAEGRDYVARVPGAAQTPLSDDELAAVNWDAAGIQPRHAARGVPPAARPEVAKSRARVLADPLKLRAELCRTLADPEGIPMKSLFAHRGLLGALARGLRRQEVRRRGRHGFPGTVGRPRLVNVYNWPDYIAPGLLEQFESETGHQGQLQHVRQQRDARDPAVDGQGRARRRGGDRELPATAGRGWRLTSPSTARVSPHYGNLDPG